MEIRTTRSIHPLTAIAAVSVTLFSLAGIGAITGLIPTSRSQPAQVQAPAPAAELLVSAPATKPSEPSPATKTTAGAHQPAAHKVAARRAKPVEQAVRPAEGPAKTVKDEPPVKVAQTDPAPKYEPAPRAEPAKPACYDCGLIESVREVEKKGEGSGLGAAVGGVAGGVLGHQTGGGRGKDVMTVLGAIGGAVAGHAIEKNVKKVKTYEIAIRLDDGSSRIVTQDTTPVWHSGDKVRFVNGVITAIN